MARVALKLVESPSHEEREVHLWPKEEDNRGHSLHYLVSYPVSFPWTLPSFFINKYTTKGDIVLDPFCGSGTSLLEAAVSGRTAIGVDSDPLAIRIANCKLQPSDLTEVTLKVQDLNFSRPVNLEKFKEYFSPFYEVETFRELLNLKQWIETNRSDPSVRFIEALALSLLHGHSAGYFSSHSYPQIALSPKEQYELNLKRRQFPDYRPVAPRLLRRVAMVTIDGLPISLRMRPNPSHARLGDPRDLSFLDTASVNLIVTSLPYPGMRDIRPEQWLKVWFSGLEQDSGWHPNFDSMESWLDYMNETLFELARVTKPGGRAILDTRELNIAGGSIKLDQELLALVESNLDRYWVPEVTLLQQDQISTTSIGTTRQQTAAGRDYRVLVLKRR